MSRLFEATIINKIKLSNRFVRSATYEGLANEDGSCTNRLTEKIAELADRSVGLIITSHTFVSPEGRARPLQLGIYKDAMISGLREMTEAVHRKKSRIILQLSHGGAQADPKISGLEALGPSTFEKADRTVSEEMSIADIFRIVESFGDAALRARQAGFDGIQIHAGHGYLLSEFLSPHFNKRNDAYGSSLENRTRFLLEVFDKIRARAGKDFAVLVKLNSEDFLENGLQMDEMVSVSQMLEAKGIDAIEISGGTPLSGKKIPSREGILKTEEEEVYYRKAASQFKKMVKVPLILVGGIRSFGVAERLVDEGLADYIALSRPLIREPHLVSRWQSGDLSKATCISCNLCYEPILSGKGLSCEVDNRLKAGK
jgi:2,4-dienoyl-CoA reductase-like NADH-dependent reductase (Old Yellow Enzyme family)